MVFEDAQRGRERLERPRLPWQHSMGVSEESSLFVSAQNRGERGIVTCELELNGRSQKTSTASGAHATARCSGRAELTRTIGNRWR